jgi:hypothetical protein
MVFRKLQGIAAQNRKPGFRILILASFLLVIPSCGPDPSMELLESYSFNFENEQGQKYNPGESINVVLKLTNNKEPAAKSFRIVFNITEGGGSVPQETVLSENADRISTVWTLGTNSLDHQLRADIFRMNGEFITSLLLTAITLRENEWDAVSADPDGRISDLAADTVAGVTLMISGGSIYRQ